MGEFPAEFAALGLQGMRRENVGELHLKIDGEFDPNGLTDEARAKVIAFYKEDFDAFGYQP